MLMFQASPSARSCCHSFAALCRAYRHLHIPMCTTPFWDSFARTCATHRRCSGARSRLRTFYALPRI